VRGSVRDDHQQPQTVCHAYSAHICSDFSSTESHITLTQNYS
jgi:hypothetical protein